MSIGIPYTIKARHPSDPAGRPPFTVHTYGETRRDELVAELTDQGFTDVTVSVRDTGAGQTVTAGSAPRR